MIAGMMRCASLAEARFFVAILEAGHGFWDDEGKFYCLDVRGVGSRTAVRTVSGHDAPRSIETTLTLQEGFGDYRIDFVLRCVWEGDRGAFKQVFFVEIDDPSHFAMPKAASDRKRDRVICAAGGVPVRFTNDDVLSDPLGCAEELLRIAFGRAVSDAVLGPVCRPIGIDHGEVFIADWDTPA